MILQVKEDKTEIVGFKANDTICGTFPRSGYRIQFNKGDQILKCEIDYLIKDGQSWRIDFFDKWGNYYDFEELEIIEENEN